MLLKWNQVGDKIFETGVDRGVLYIPDVNGDYTEGVAWNGLISLKRSSAGGQVTPYYIDGIKYLHYAPAEDFSAVLEAFTYPDEFAIFDGAAEIDMGFFVNEQPRKMFGLSYRTKVGDDVDSHNLGYKIHLVYGALAIPTEQTYQTMGDSPEATLFSWDISALPVNVPGFKPAASLTLDSTKLDIAAMYGLENILYGDFENDPRLPLPNEIAVFIAENSNLPLIMTEDNNMLLSDNGSILLSDDV